MLNSAIRRLFVCKWTAGFSFRCIESHTLTTILIFLHRCDYPLQCRADHQPSSPSPTSCLSAAGTARSVWRASWSRSARPPTSCCCRPRSATWTTFSSTRRATCSSSTSTSRRPRSAPTAWRAPERVSYDGARGGGGSVAKSVFYYGVRVEYKSPKTLLEVEN